MDAKKAATIHEYIAGFPLETQVMLNQLYQLIKKTAPAAEETISYAIPAFRLNGILIYFAAFKNHVSVYPAPREVPEFKEELASYKGGKGTVQFFLDKPLPVKLITRIVKYRKAQNEEKSAIKKAKK